MPPNTHRKHAAELSESAFERRISLVREPTPGAAADPSARGTKATRAPRASSDVPCAGTEIRADEEIRWAERIRQGDAGAFEAMFRGYYTELCHFAAGFVGSFDLGREVVQEVLLKIWKRRAQWRVHTTLRAYLYQAVRNQGLNDARQERRRRSVPLDQSLPEPTTRHTPEEELSHREQLRAVQDAIERLPERRRTAFTLHRRHGLSYGEIAEVMDISPRTVEVHISKALKTLRETARR